MTVRDAIQYILKTKWRWASHRASLKSTGGQSEQPNGNSEKGKEQEPERRDDGAMKIMNKAGALWAREAKADNGGNV